MRRLLFIPLLFLCAIARAGAISGYYPYRVASSSFPAGAVAAGGGGGATCGGTIKVFQSTFTSGSGAPVVVTATAPVTAGHTIIVAVTSGDNFTNTIISTDNKNNAWRLVVANNNGTFSNIGIFSSTNIATGGSGYTVAFDPGGGYIEMAMIEVEGLSCSGALDGANTGAALDASPTTGSVATNATDLLVGVFGFDSSLTSNFSPGSGYTLVYQDGNNNDREAFAMEYKIAGAGTVVADGTYDQACLWNGQLQTFR